MQRLLSQRKRNGVSHWTSTADAQKEKENLNILLQIVHVILGKTFMCVGFLQQRWSSSSELSPQSLSPSHFQWGWTHTWFLHSNRKGGQYVPLGKRVAESKSHSVNFVSVSKLRILKLNDAQVQRAKKCNMCRILTTGCFICIVQTVWVAITFEALSNTMSTVTLEVTRMASPQLCNNTKWCTT